MIKDVICSTKAIEIDKVYPILKDFKKRTNINTCIEVFKDVDFTKITLYIVNFNDNDPYAMIKFKNEMDFIYYRFKPNTFVQINITSPGGSVTSYAYASSLIERLKNLGAYIIVNIDVMACSGGYMMAAVADQIIANPMAFVGSIGVVAEVPDISKFLNDHGIEYNTYTAGENKRTVVPTRKHSKQQVKHFKSKLKEIHDAFIEHIRRYRPLDDKYIKGDDYLAENVVGETALVDGLTSSEDIRDLFYVNGSKIMLVNTKLIGLEKKKPVIRLFSKVEAILDNIQNILSSAKSSYNPSNIDMK